MTINTLAALAWGLLTVNTQTDEYTVIRGIDLQAQCARARTYGFCSDSIKSRRPDFTPLCCGNPGGVAPAAQHGRLRQPQPGRCHLTM